MLPPIHHSSTISSSLKLWCYPPCKFISLCLWCNDFLNSWHASDVFCTDSSGIWDMRGISCLDDVSKTMNLLWKGQNIVTSQFPTLLINPVACIIFVYLLWPLISLKSICQEKIHRKYLCWCMIFAIKFQSKTTPYFNHTWLVLGASRVVDRLGPRN